MFQLGAKHRIYYREETITAAYVYAHMLPRIPRWPDPGGATTAILIHKPRWGLAFMSRKDSGRRSQALPIKHNLSGGSSCSRVGSRWAQQQIALSAARTAPLLAHCTPASAGASLPPRNIKAVFFSPFHFFTFTFFLLSWVWKENEKGARHANGGRNLVVLEDTDFISFIF